MIFRFFIFRFDEQSYEWIPNLEAGTKFIVNVFDQGNDQYSEIVTIGESRPESVALLGALTFTCQ